MKALRLDVLGLAFILVWASGYVVGSLATQVIAPLAVTLWRFVVAALVLAAYARWRGEVWPRGRELASLALIGVPLFAIQFGALYTAMAEGMPAATTALIACSSPLLVAVVGVLGRWDHLTARQWCGIAVGVVGVVVTLAERVGRPPSPGVLAWTLLGLAGLAGGSVLQSRVRTSAGPAAVAATELAAGAAVLAVWAPLKGDLDIPFTAHALGSFVWLALVAGVGAPMLLFALIRQRGATRATSLLFVVPAVTAIAGWPILGKPIAPLTVVGLAIAALGLWLVRKRPAAAAAAAPAAAASGRPPATVALDAAPRT